MLTVGLIGCGGMGNMHLNCYLALKDKVKVVAVADLIKDKADSFGARSGAKAYYSAKDLLENETPDIIDICLPTHLHTTYSVQAMEKGCNLFCEKPVCLNEEEIKLLIDTQKRTGVKAQIGQVVRFMDPYAWLKKVVDDGTYGKVLNGHFIRLSANPAWAEDNWFNDPEKSGTMALDLHIHDVDFVRYLLGEPDKVSAVARRDANGAIIHMNSNFMFGDTYVGVEASWDMPSSFSFTAEFRVMLEKGTAVLLNGKGLVFYPVDGEPFSPQFDETYNINVDSGINVSGLGGYVTEINYFIDEVIGKNGKEIAPISEAAKSVQLVLEEIDLVGGKVKK